MTLPKITVDPKLDLVLERELDVPVELVWRAWTTAEHLRHWFVPKPWTITACDLDVRPGGAMNFTIRSPEGQEFPNSGCYLEVKPFERLVTTDTLLGGYRPSSNPFFTAVLDFARNGEGTRYRAIAIHGEEASRQKHEENGLPRWLGHGGVADGGIHQVRPRGSLTAVRSIWKRVVLPPAFHCG